jgi:hypothetical protein
MGEASHVAAILLLFGAATADAQVTPPPNPAGAYQKLSPGHQKVARALFEAQHAPTTTTTKTSSGKTTTASSSAAAGAAQGPKPLTLDQIAAMKQAGTGWEQVFRQMRAQGLITDKNIATVVTRYNQQSARTPSASVVTTTAAAASDRAVSPGRGSAALAGNRVDDGYGRSGNLR